MTNIEFVNKAREISKLKTLYVNGCYGARMTEANKQKYLINTKYNRQVSRQAKIKAANSDIYGFDCINFIKAILWGFPSVKYASNGVPDIGEDTLIRQCSPSSNWRADIPVGAVLWMQGHIGIYLGDCLCVEATPAWKDGVQITNVANLRGFHKDYPSRAWTKWGRLPYLTYLEDEMIQDITVMSNNKKVTVKGIVKDGNNYIKLRDLDDALGIANVSYDAAAKLPVIDPK